MGFSVGAFDILVVGGSCSGPVRACDDGLSVPPFPMFEGKNWNNRTYVGMSVDISTVKAGFQGRLTGSTT